MNEQRTQHTLALINQAMQACHPDFDAGFKPSIIIGLSGGPDSVFLLLLLKQLQDQKLIDLQAAHLNHGWRENADADVNFCRDLCHKLGISLTIEHAKNLAIDIKPNGSKEEIGRKLRRHFFEQVRTQKKANFVMLAHHLQDQQETFFLRMLRGATLSGLCSMQPVAGIYLRPLLEVSKQEMLDYLHEQGIAYCIDETNQADDFLRNRIRKKVLPAMKACDERFDGNFMRLIEHLHADNALLERLTKDAFEQVFKGTLRDTRCTRSSGRAGLEEVNSEFIEKIIAVRPVLQQAQDDSILMAARPEEGCKPVSKGRPYVASKQVFLTLDHQLQRRVILYWLIQEKVSFVPSDNFLSEIIRFIQCSRGGFHQLHMHWKIVKRKDLFWLEKMTDKLT